MGTHHQQIVAHLFLITGTTRGIGPALAASALGQANSFVVSLSREAPFPRGNHQNIHLDINHTGERDSPVHAASKLIRLLMQDRHENGGRYDLREMAG
ncbi:hypothetical protein [Desulfosarcina sp.]|uniref:hypothetical protein n=1 Tax=Desulfosarcina sp. TaxID=2027861 RepID=UPI00397090A7